ncbi:hypothetical protein GCM10010234_68660 [Streptomyces hawaiiensis]
MPRSNWWECCSVTPRGYRNPHIRLPGGTGTGGRHPGILCRTGHERSTGEEARVFLESKA